MRIVSIKKILDPETFFQKPEYAVSDELLQSNNDSEKSKSDTKKA